MSRRKILGLVSLVSVVLVFWPWLGNPRDFVKWEDRFKTSVPIALVFGESCETREGGVIFHDTGPDCYRFSEFRDYSGIWINQFEGSTFIEGGEEVPRKRPPFEETAWLRYDPPKEPSGTDILDYDEELGCYPIAAYYVRFVGRERPGGGGHLGLWGREIWPERMLKIEQLPAPNCQTY